MAKRRRRNPRPEERYGILSCGDDGSSSHMSFLPRRSDGRWGVSHRVRYLADAERLFEDGQVSPDDIERVRKNWALCQERWRNNE